MLNDEPAIVRSYEPKLQLSNFYYTKGTEDWAGTFNEWRKRQYHFKRQPTTNHDSKAARGSCSEAINAVKQYERNKVNIWKICEMWTNKTSLIKDIAWFLDYNKKFSWRKSKELWYYLRGKLCTCMYHHIKPKPGHCTWRVLKNRIQLSALLWFVVNCRIKWYWRLRFSLKVQVNLSPLLSIQFIMHLIIDFIHMTWWYGVRQ